MSARSHYYSSTDLVPGIYIVAVHDLQPERFQIHSEVVCTHTLFRQPQFETTARGSVSSLGMYRLMLNHCLAGIWEFV